MKTKLMEMIEAGIGADFKSDYPREYAFTGKEFQAIFDEGFREQKFNCLTSAMPWLKSASSQKAVNTTPQPETGIKL